MSKDKLDEPDDYSDKDNTEQESQGKMKFVDKLGKSFILIDDDNYPNLMLALDAYQSKTKDLRVNCVYVAIFDKYGTDYVGYITHEKFKTMLSKNTVYNFDTMTYDQFQNICVSRNMNIISKDIYKKHKTFAIQQLHYEFKISEDEFIIKHEKQLNDIDVDPYDFYKALL